jgi:hypothetical protein
VLGVEFYQQADLVEYHVPILGGDFVAVVVDDVLDDPEHVAVDGWTLLVDEDVDEDDALFEIGRVLLALGLSAFDGGFEAKIGEVDQIVDPEVYHQLVFRLNQIEEQINDIFPNLTQTAMVD